MNKFELKPSHYVALLGVVLILFFVGSFIYITWDSFGSEGGVLSDALVDTRKDLDFKTIQEQLKPGSETENDPDELDIKQLENHLKNPVRSKSRKDSLIDSLRAELDGIRQKLAVFQEKSSAPAKPSPVPQKRSSKKRIPPRKRLYPPSIDFSEYLNKNKKSSKASRRSKYKWAKVFLEKEQRIYNSSIIFLSFLKETSYKNETIPRKSKVEGTCRLSRNRLYINFKAIYTPDDREIAIAGSAFHLDHSPGIPINVKSNKDPLKRLGHQMSGLADIFDPTQTVSQGLKDQLDSPVEHYADLPRKMMLLVRFQFQK